jgi:hypothetical protein
MLECPHGQHHFVSDGTGIWCRFCGEAIALVRKRPREELREAYPMPAEPQSGEPELNTPK